MFINIAKTTGIFLLFSMTANAAPVLNPDNGHYYEAIEGSFDWTEARDLAAASSFNGVQGHLATITSAAEDSWIWNNLGSDLGLYLLGATDAANEGDYQWITGEAFNYTNWAPNEPNNGLGSENYLQFWFTENGGVWNDISNDQKLGFHNGYVVEYSGGSQVPLPAAFWLFGIGMVGLISKSRKKV